MERLKNNYFIVVIVLAVAGIAIQYVAGGLDISFEKIEMIENGVIVSKDVYKPSPLQPLLNLLSGFLITLAVSIFVSMFILRRMEHFEKEVATKQLDEMRKQINEDVFNSLFKTLVPEEIYEVIKDQIIRNQLVRKNAVWIYDFKLLENGCFELKQTLKSEIHNLGITTYEKNYTLSFRTSGEISESKLDRFMCEYRGAKIADIQSNGSIFEKDGAHECPLKIPPGEHADITLVFKTIYKGAEVADTYYTSHALINATLLASYPAGYKLHLFNSFSSDIRETSSDETSAIYELKGAILPGQGMTYHLIRENSHNKSSQSDASKAGAAA